MGRVIVESLQDGIVRLILDNRGKKNAIDGSLRDMLVAALDSAIRDETIKAIVLTGADAEFSAGGDIAFLLGLESKDLIAWLHETQWVIHALATCHKPVIAAVQGVCAGGALGLALGADVIIAGASARFACNFHGIGLVPDLGLIYTLPRRVGVAAARRFANASSALDSKASLEIGLVDRVVPDDQVQSIAVEEANRLASMPKPAFEILRQALNDGVPDLDTALKWELRAQAECFQSAEFVHRATRFAARHK